MTFNESFLNFFFLLPLLTQINLNRRINEVAVFISIHFAKKVLTDLCINMITKYGRYIDCELDNGDGFVRRWIDTRCVRERKKSHL